MSDLKSTEKLKLEKFLEMGKGYVLNFSDRTLKEFILESIGVDIYEEKYNYNSGSKANRLRALWKEESNYLISRLISDLLRYWKDNRLLRDLEITQNEQELYNECLNISERLKQNTPIENLDAIQANTDEKDFSLLANLIRDSIESNKPESALDRLHTFVVKYFRQCCRKHNIHFEISDPLHSIFGKYVKYLEAEEVVQSTMSRRILKSAISVLDAFNTVRNDQSFAHDNQILNYHESILIFNHVSSLIKFVDTIEEHIIDQRKVSSKDISWDEF
ncbi:MAG: abortive infection family protein [Bacteroidota bacterium]